MSPGFFPLVVGVAAAGVGALAFETAGFRVVTSDGARSLAIAERPRAVPDVRLVDQEGRDFSLADYRGAPVLVEFVYTRCPTICSVLGDDFHRVLTAAPGRDFALLSISFDPAHDDRAARADYGQRFGAAAPRWRIAVPADAGGLAALERSFGVVVIPDGMGGFVHNGAVYLVDGEGRLARVLDPDAPPALLAAALGEAAR